MASTAGTSDDTGITEYDDSHQLETFTAWIDVGHDAVYVAASARAAEQVVDDTVYRRSATGGDAKVLRHEGIPTVEFGFGTQTAHGTDEYTTATALARNAISYATIPLIYDERSTGD